jgi:hypothetical protein
MVPRPISVALDFPVPRATFRFRKLIAAGGATNRPPVHEENQRTELSSQPSNKDILRRRARSKSVRCLRKLGGECEVRIRLAAEDDLRLASKRRTASHGSSKAATPTLTLTLPVLPS